ncbi:MAG: hypothetical protein ACE3JP_08720 [Ectobacillus sp.]
MAVLEDNIIIEHISSDKAFLLLSFYGSDGYNKVKLSTAKIFFSVAG